MLDKSFGLLFYLKKPKNYQSGEVPIYLRVTVDSIPKEISVKRSCDPARWNASAGRASGTKESIKSLNAFLDTFQQRVYDIKRKMIEDNEIITSSAIKNRLLGLEDRSKMLIQIFEEYNAKMKSLIGVDFAEGTWTKYERTKRFTKEFIQWKYKSDDIHIKQLDFEFVTELERYYKLRRKCCHNTAIKYISILNTVILFCVANRWLDHEPFALFKMSTEEVETVYLTDEELHIIANRRFSIERLERVKDVYIFCCFTGLSFADVKKLNRSEIKVGVDNELWIFSDRQKTNIQAKIPLLPVALDILKKYENDIACIGDNQLLPVLSNQKYNSYLKEIADLCGISKRLTTHTARHTFGTSVTLANGVPIETVSKMLGHKKITTTQHYARS